MNKGRRIGALMVASAAALGMASVGLASPAVAAERGPQPTSTWLRAVKSHTSTWSQIAWRTNERICNVQVRVDGGRKVRVDYPGTRRFTSFSHSNSLGAGRTDFTAIRVNPDFDRSGVAVLRATIQYDTCGFHARRQGKTSLLTLPVVAVNRPGSHDGPGNGSAGNGQGAQGGNDQHGNGQGGGDQHGNGQGSNPGSGGQGGSSHSGH